MGNFDTCFPVTMKFEDPHFPNDSVHAEVHTKGDLGGATKWGVTQQTYDQFRRQRYLTQRDVGLMDACECKTVYRVFFYQPFNLDGVSLPWAVLLYDAFVNCGPKYPIEWVQVLVGTEPDGDMGPKTLAAIKAHSADLALMDKFINRREAHNQTLVDNMPSQARFLNGWTDRCETLRTMVHSGKYV